jgi:hypothetical protein
MLHDEGDVPVAPPCLVRALCRPAVVQRCVVLPRAVNSAVLAGRRAVARPVLERIDNSGRRGAVRRRRGSFLGGVIPALRNQFIQRIVHVILFDKIDRSAPT